MSLRPGAKCLAKRLGKLFNYAIVCGQIKSCQVFLGETLGRSDVGKTSRFCLD